MRWLSTADTSSTALDNLARNIPAPQQTAPKPAPQRVIYAAFAQAGGFDANGSWGAATAANLNAAIGMAETTCSNGGQNLCGDEGYCILQSGLWGGWASDLMVAGNSAFACNFKSQDEARSQAQAWCGPDCKVLWSGAGQ